MSIKQLIENLPFPVKQSIKYIYGAIPYQIRCGKIFRDTYKSLQESQWWSREKLEDYQMQQLSKLLHHAYENVPYYRKVFNERGLKPRNIQDFDDLRKLPYLTKEIIRKNLNELIARNISNRKLILVRTSGSTASPLSLYYEKRRTDLLENAFLETLWNRVGYQSKYKRINLTWEIVNKNNSWWEYNPVHKILTLSPRQMSDENLHNYVKMAERFEPKSIKAIPSTIIVWANFMQRNNISPLSSVKVILLSSEMLYPWQRESIRKAFDCRIFSWYGQIERVVLAGECEVSDKYHISPEYGVTELIGQNGDQIKQEGQRGEIVGTGFNNYAMPFIRYRTGDIASLSNRKCCCGRNRLLLESIEGRKHNFIVLENGNLVPLLALPFSSLLSNVKQFQFYQDKPGEIVLRIVKMPSYTQKDSESILKGLCEGLNNVKLHLDFVSHIPKTKRGKYMYMVQKLPVEVEN